MLTVILPCDCFYAWILHYYCVIAYCTPTRINGDDEVEESADPVDSQAPVKAAVGGKKGKKGHRKKDDDW